MSQPYEGAGVLLIKAPLFYPPVRREKPHWAVDTWHHRELPPNHRSAPHCRVVRISFLTRYRIEEAWVGYYCTLTALGLKSGACLHSAGT